MSRILVTGATGFIGRALVEALVQAGEPVTAALRDRRNPPAWPAAVRIVEVGDISGETDWRSALDGVERIIHLAGIAHQPIADDGATVARYHTVNVAGTAALASAAARAGAARLVLLSSVKVNGETTAGRAFTEQDTPAPRDIYGRSKWQAEQALTQIASATTLSYTVLRSPLVYGPGVGGNFASLIRLCDSPWPLPFGALDNRRSLIARGNLVSAILAALSHPAAANQTFLLRDGEDLSTAGLVRAIRQALGRPPGLLPIPPALLGGALRLIGRGGMADRLFGSLAVDDTKIRASLNWRPPVTPAQALSETVKTYAMGRRG